MKDLLGEKERIALTMQNAGDKQGIIVDMSGKTLEELDHENQIRKFNKEVDAYAENFQNHINSLKEGTEKLASNVETMENVEIMPIGNYVLVHQFKENPFQRIVQDKASGFITDLGGFSPVFKNTDSGEYEQEHNIIKVGVVYEVGPECKWCRVGDTIMFTEMSAVPVPFYKMGLQLVNETRVLVTINENLKERFENGGK